MGWRKGWMGRTGGRDGWEGRDGLNTLFD
jgi:hypothetical protein